MFWLRRNRFVGSYSSLSARRRRERLGAVGRAHALLALVGEEVHVRAAGERGLDRGVGVAAPTATACRTPSRRDGAAR